MKVKESNRRQQYRVACFSNFSLRHYQQQQESHNNQSIYSSNFQYHQIQFLDPNKLHSHNSIFNSTMGTTVDDSCATQLIDGDGVFNLTGLDNFIKTSNMANTGLSYAVVAIMGPQSSGNRFSSSSIFTFCYFSFLIRI